MSYRQDALIAQLRTALTKGERRSAVAAFMDQPGPAQTKERAALNSEMRALLRTAPVTPVETRAAGETTAAAGGDLVPPGFASEVIHLIHEYDSVLADLEDVETAKGNSWKRPQVSSLVASGGTVVEGTQLVDKSGTVPVFIGQQTFGQTPTYPVLLVASMQLIEDSEVDATHVLASAAAESIGRQIAADASTALYAAAPAGQQVSLSGGAVSIASVSGLLASLDPGYHKGAKLYVSPTDYAALVAEDPTKLKNLPVPVVPTNAATTYVSATVSGPILANLKRFMSARRARGVQMQVLRERYAEYYQIGVVVYVRMDFQARGEDTSAVFSK